MTAPGTGFTKRSFTVLEPVPRPARAGMRIGHSPDRTTLADAIGLAPVVLLRDS